MIEIKTSLSPTACSLRKGWNSSIFAGLTTKKYLICYLGLYIRTDKNLKKKKKERHIDCRNRKVTNKLRERSENEGENILSK